MKKVTEYLEQVIEAARRVDLGEVCRAVDALKSAYDEGRGVYIIGNGGSAAAASHFAQDLSKGALPDFERGKRFRVLSLTDNVSFMTALSNDLGYERVFDLQLRQFAKPGDLLVAISGSGNSPNILRAVEYALSQNMGIISVTGFDGGKLMPQAQIRLHVPLNDMCKSEAVHSILLHMVADLLKLKLSP